MKMDDVHQEDILLALGTLASVAAEDNPDLTPVEWVSQFKDFELEELNIDLESLLRIADSAFEETRGYRD